MNDAQYEQLRQAQRAVAEVIKLLSSTQADADQYGDALKTLGEAYYTLAELRIDAADAGNGVTA